MVGGSDLAGDVRVVEAGGVGVPDRVVHDLQAGELRADPLDQAGDVAAPLGERHRAPGARVDRPEVTTGTVGEPLQQIDVVEQEVGVAGGDGPADLSEEVALVAGVRDVGRVLGAAARRAAGERDEHRGARRGAQDPVGVVDRPAVALGRHLDRVEVAVDVGAIEHGLATVEVGRVDDHRVVRVAQQLPVRRVRRLRPRVELRLGVQQQVEAPLGAAASGLRRRLERRAARACAVARGRVGGRGALGRRHPLGGRHALGGGLATGRGSTDDERPCERGGEERRAATARSTGRAAGSHGLGPSRDERAVQAVDGCRPVTVGALVRPVSSARHVLVVPACEGRARDRRAVAAYDVA